MPAYVRLNLLGGFELVVDGAPARIPECSERLIVFLALRDRPQPRLLVAGSLWPEKSDQRAMANLRSSLWRCRLGDGFTAAVPDGSRLRLAPQVELDVTEFESTGRALLEEPAAAVIDGVDRGIFYRELLPGWYDDWVVFERERLMQLQLHYGMIVTEVLLHAGRDAEACDLRSRLRLRERASMGELYPPGQAPCARRDLPAVLAGQSWRR